jgi:hypothetical protein
MLYLLVKNGCLEAVNTMFARGTAIFNPPSGANENRKIGILISEFDAQKC